MATHTSLKARRPVRQAAAYTRSSESTLLRRVINVPFATDARLRNRKHDFVALQPRFLAAVEEHGEVTPDLRTAGVELRPIVNDAFPILVQRDEFRFIFPPRVECNVVGSAASN